MINVVMFLISGMMCVLMKCEHARPISISGKLEKTWKGKGVRARFHAHNNEELFYYHTSGETITVLAASTYLDLPDSTISFINPSMGLSVEYTVT